MGNTNGYYKKLDLFLNTLDEKKAYFVRNAIRRSAFRDFLVSSRTPNEDWLLIYNLYHHCLENDCLELAERIRSGIAEYNTDFDTQYNLTA